MPRWARGAPERLVFWSTESGVYQVHVWDRASGVRRRVTDHPVGVIFGALTPDGERVLFWQDETGSEAGQWYAEPFAGGAAEPFLPGIAQGWNQGLAQRPGLVAAGISDAGGFSAYVSIDGEPPKEIWRSTESISIGGAEHGRDDLGGLSADGTMLALEHAEHGDSMHPAVRVVDARTGSTIAEQVDEGLALHASCWSPVPGDQRLVVTHEREGEERPAVWHLTTGSWTDLDLGLSGPVEAVDWWPDTHIWWFGGTPRDWERAGGDPRDLAAHHWVREVGAIEAGLALVPTHQVRRITYEQLVATPREVIYDVAAFAGLGDDPTWQADLDLVRFPNRNAAADADERVAAIQTDTLRALGYVA